MKKNKLFLSIILTLFLVYSCKNTNNDNNVIYNLGEVYTFNVKGVNDIEKIELEITDEYYPEQTKIYWHHYSSLKSKEKKSSEWTGLIDDGKEFFIHQPRSEEFHILSFANFPSVTIELDKDFANNTTSEGTVSMMKKYNDILIKKVKTAQKYIGKEMIVLSSIGERNLHKYYHSAQSELGKIDGYFFFDKELGFVKFIYNLPNKKTIELELSKLPYSKI
jgi:hypothetical protein